MATRVPLAGARSGRRTVPRRPTIKPMNHNESGRCGGTEPSHGLPILLRLLRNGGLEGALDPTAAMQLFVEARHHDLEGLVYEAVGAREAVLSSRMLEELRDRSLSVSAYSMRARLQLVRCLRGLAASGVVPVLLKGPALAARYWPNPATRPSTDVDLLVGPADFERADRALRAMGMVPLDTELEDEVRRRHHHLHYRGDAALVELHFRLNSGIGSGLTWELVAPNVREAEFAGHPVRYLGREDELIYLAVHAAGHLFQRLSWLWDLNLYVRREAIDWDALVETSRRAQVATAVWLALDLAREALGAPIPREALSRLKPDEVRARALTLLFPVRSLVRHPLSDRASASAAVRLLLSDSIRTSAGLMARGLSRNARRRLGVRFPRWTPPSWRRLF